MVKLLFSYQGRINRAQYWAGGVIVFAVGAMLLAMLLLPIIGAASDKNAPALISSLVALGMFLVPIWILCAWCGFSLHVKRLHDRGKSGWWAVILLIPMLLSLPTFMALAGGKPPVNALIAIPGNYLITTLVNLWALIELGSLPGQREANRFGEPPGGGGGVSPRPAPDAGPAKPSAAMLSAQSAMDRAIADQSRAGPFTAAPAAAGAARAPMRAPATQAPSGGFGRKPAR